MRPFLHFLKLVAIFALVQVSFDLAQKYTFVWNISLFLGAYYLTTWGIKVIAWLDGYYTARAALEGEAKPCWPPAVVR